MKNKMTLDRLASLMKGGFERLERKMEAKFDGVGQEFVKLYDRFNKVDQRLDKVEATIAHNHAELSGRLTSVESRTTVLESK